MTSLFRTRRVLALLATAVLIPAAWANGGIDGAACRVVIHTENGAVELQPYSPGTIRVEAAPGKGIPGKRSLAVIAAPEAAGWSVKEDAENIRLVGERLVATVNKQTGLVSFSAADGTPLLRQLGWSFQPARNPGRDGLQVGASFERTPGDHFYGGGVLGGELRQSSAEIEFTNRDAQIRVPVIYSSRGYEIFWDNAGRSELKLTPDSVTWNSTAGDLADYYVMAGPTAGQVVAEYRSLTGAVPLFPRWAYGFWFSKNKFKRQDGILNAASEFRSHRFPIDLIVQDAGYWPHGLDHGGVGWGTHEFDPTRYPDPKAMVDELHRRYHLHFMAVVWPKFDPDTAHAKELAAANGLFPRNGDWAGPLLQFYDPFNSKAREIYGRQVMDSFLPLGVDAIWMDAAEPEIAPDKLASFDSGAGPASRVMSAYPLVHAEGIYQAQRGVTDRKRVVLLIRSAWAGMQRAAACNWTGDIVQNWPTLARQIEGLQNYSITGLPYITTDIGGYQPDAVSKSDPELYVRWFEWGAFCPIFRTHGMARPLPWEYGSEAEAILKRFDELRYRLLPYIYAQAGAITEENGTLLRPLVMDFRNDAQALKTWDEYMFGPSLLVCPVYQPSVQSKEVYLPGAASWCDFWTGKRSASGQTLKVETPLNMMPIYVRAGAILPMGPLVQYADEKPADPIELRVYRGADGSFKLYEDEGDNYDYEKGAFSEIPIAWNEASRTLTFGERAGRYPGMLAERTFRIVWVSPGHGIGGQVTDPVDAEVSYGGHAMSVRAPRIFR